MKRMLSVFSVCLLAGAASAAVVYEDTFDGDGLGTNTGTGGGLSVTAAANSASWGDGGDLAFAPNAGAANERAVVASLNSFNLPFGFELTVSYSVSDITTDTGGNRFSFGLLNYIPTTFNTDPFGLTNGTRPTDYSGLGLNVTAEDSLQGLILAERVGGTFNHALVAGQTGFTSSTTEVNTVTLTVDPAGNYGLVLNGSSVGSGASGLDLSSELYFVAYSQDDLANPSISSVVLSTLEGGANLPPVANEQDITIFPGASTNITLTGVDYEGSNLTYEVTGFPADGTLVTNGALPNLTYTPDGGFQGIDSFTFIVNDGDTNSAPATVSITVTNELPVADAQGVSTDYETAVAITLTGSDPDGGPSSLTFDYTNPANGTLSGSAPNLTYTPDGGYAGADAFTFTVNDGLDDSVPATVSIVVNGAGVSSVTLAIGNGSGESGTQVGAGAFNTTKNGLDARNGTLWGVANTADVAGMLYWTYADVAGTALPSTIQAGTYTFTAAVGNNGDGAGFSGLNDISSGTNTTKGVVAGFFTTLQTGTGGANSDKADANKNKMYTEFNAISGVTYTAPVEAEPANDDWTTWTFTWEVAEGSAVIGSSPYFGVYTRTGTTGGGNGFWDDSTMSFEVGYVPPTGIDDFGVEMVPGGSQVAFSWTAVSGASYGVQARNSLMFGTWSNIVQNVDGIDGVVSVTNTISEEQQFFRAYLED